MRHRRTDPACRQFRHPRSALGLWWFDRHRGLACPMCYGQHEHTRRYLPTAVAVALVALAVGVMLAIGAALWTLGGVR